MGERRVLRESREEKVWRVACPKHLHSFISPLRVRAAIGPGKIAMKHLNSEEIKLGGTPGGSCLFNQLVSSFRVGVRSPISLQFQKRLSMARCLLAFGFMGVS